MTPTMTGAAGTPFLGPADLAQQLLDPARLADRQARADRLLVAEGAGYLVHDLPVRADGRSAALESRPWRLDPIPVVLDAATFRWLSLAVAERMEALDRVIADLYGDRTLVKEGIVPAEALASTQRYRQNAVGARPHRWLSTYSVDVALDADGTWYVVQDLTDAPPGLGYALLDRSVISRVVPDVMADTEIASLARFPASLRRALAAASGDDSPRIVLFSGGIDHPSYVDHSYLAVQLGVNLVEGADLVVRQRRVWLRTLDGLEPVDVLYRRLEDSTIDPLEVSSHGTVGVPGLLLAVRSNGVTLANAHGSGIIEAPELGRYVDTAIERLGANTQGLPRLVDPRRPLATSLLAPGSVAPDLERAPVVIRMFAVHDGVTAHVLPGGTGRVLAPGDHPLAPTAACAKDVWVLGRTMAPSIGPRLPQVDFGRSVPTRAADALYWTNRAAERAEAMARAMRVISSRVEQDHGLTALAGGEWTARMCRVAAGVRRQRAVDVTPGPSLDDLDQQLALIDDAVGEEIGALLTEATTVREFLSVTTGRVLSHLAQLRSSLQLHTTMIDDLDAVLADFAALAGLWQESTVRGPAWRIGDTGRRLERCLVVLDLLEATFLGEPLADPRTVDAHEHATTEIHDRGETEEREDVTASVVEVLLASCDSLVAYRRRHRSDVEPDAALTLLVRDAANPRSLAASIERLAVHAADGETALGDGFIDDARAALELPVEELVPRLRSLIDEAGIRMIGRWFSTPVNPIVMTERSR